MGVEIGPLVPVEVVLAVAVVMLVSEEILSLDRRIS